MRAPKGLATLVAAGVFSATVVPSAAAQTSVLVDATSGSGVWWYPQGGPYDPNQPHQGKALADHLRTQGMTVTELSPSAPSITFEQLGQYDLVLAIDGCNGYVAAERSAYASYVSGSGRVMLLTDARSDNCNVGALAQVFGLVFTGATPVTSVGASRPIGSPPG